MDTKQVVQAGGLKRGFGYVIVAFAVVPLAMAVFLSVRPLRLAIAGQSGEGVVTRIQQISNYSDYPRGTSKVADIQFEAGQQKVTIRKGLYVAPWVKDRSVGERVVVRYLPTDPEAAEIDSFTDLYFGPLACAGMALLMTLIALAFLRVSRAEKMRRSGLSGLTKG
jgi:hypothetical protein